MPDTGNVAVPPNTARTPSAGPGVADYVLRFSDTVVELGYCKRDALETLRNAFEETRAAPDTFGQFLVERGALTREQSRACERSLRGGSVIGGFAILEKVGQGGMGSVFRARQISMDRIVAVKILAPKFAQDPVFKERFLQEARTCAKLSHLNIINGIDCGEDAGYAYFAMEFVDGQTLRRLMKTRGKFSCEETYPIVRQICDALSYARKLDMVHRDIKPDNIMVTPANVAKLCDLGLAIQAEAERKEAEDEAEAEQGKASGGGDGTGSNNGSAGSKTPKGKGLALGTPHYMSPEQAQGQPNIDARSDIYSLGATIYHLITGQTMFTGASSTAIMTQHVTSVAASPCEIDPAIPRSMGSIISKMTAKTPADRYANVDELIEDLERYKRRAKPLALACSAPSSCRWPAPPSAKENAMRWVPHAAAAVVLGVLAYFGVQHFSGKSGAGQTIPGETSGTQVATHNTVSSVTDSPKTVITPSAVAHVDVKPSTQQTVTSTTTEKIATVKTTTATAVKPDVKPDVATVVKEFPPVKIDEAPPLEIDKPALKLTPEILYTRFLAAVEARINQNEGTLPRVDLGKLAAEVKEDAKAPEYAPARADIDAEINDIVAARDFELSAMKGLADSHAMVQLSAKAADKWGVPSMKAQGFNDRRGLDVDYKGAQFSIWANSVAPDDLAAHAADKSPLAKAQFYYAHGHLQEWLTQIPFLSAAEQKRWGRKNELKQTTERELTAWEAFNTLTPVAAAKAWKTLDEMLTDFNHDYNGTTAAKANAAKLAEYREMISSSSQPQSRWRKVFHATSVKDFTDKGQQNWIELTYDFSSKDQLKDFICQHGAMKYDGKHLVVPAGGGEYASLHFIAPLDRIRMLQVTVKSNGTSLQPMGVAFLEGDKVNVDPQTGSSMLRLEPESRIAVLMHMNEVSFETAKPPELNWLRDLTYGFTVNKGHQDWKIDNTTVFTARLPKQVEGGWLAFWARDGNFSLSSLKLSIKPDPLWEEMMLGAKPKPPPKEGPPDDKKPPPPPAPAETGTPAPKPAPSPVPPVAPVPVAPAVPAKNEIPAVPPPPKATRGEE